MNWWREKRARQLAIFDGLDVQGCTPTDIDGLFEWKNKAYIIIELKTGNKDVPYGQELALTRMADDFEKSGKPAIVIIGEHYDSEDEDIIVKDCRVRCVYFDGKWYKGKPDENVKQHIDRFIDSIEVKDGKRNRYH